MKHLKNTIAKTVLQRWNDAISIRLKLYSFHYIMFYQHAKNDHSKIAGLHNMYEVSHIQVPYYLKHKSSGIPKLQLKYIIMEDRPIKIE